MNLKKLKEQEVEFYKKIGLYCGVEFNRTQKICKYLSDILAFAYFLIFADRKSTRLNSSHQD